MAIEIRQTPVRATATRRRIARRGIDTSLQGVQTLARITEFLVTQYADAATSSAFDHINSEMAIFDADLSKQLSESTLDSAQVFEIWQSSSENAKKAYTDATAEAVGKLPFGLKGSFEREAERQGIEILGKRADFARTKMVNANYRITDLRVARAVEGGTEAIKAEIENVLQHQITYEDPAGSFKILSAALDKAQISDIATA